MQATITSPAGGTIVGLGGGGVALGIWQKLFQTIHVITVSSLLFYTLEDFDCVVTPI